jgi:hypothetical protein
MPDFEAVKSRRVSQRRFRVLSDESAQFTLQNCLQKCSHLILFAGRQKFHPAIAQIAHRTGDVEAFRYLLDGITKAHALDVALVKDLNGCCHASED